MPEPDADTVLTLARERGHEWIDRETAGRIAAGAAIAIRAVLESERAFESETLREPSPWSAAARDDPAGFLDELAQAGKKR
jgi:hypothetical protein